MEARRFEQDAEPAAEPQREEPRFGESRFVENEPPVEVPELVPGLPEPAELSMEAAAPLQELPEEADEEEDDDDESESEAELRSGAEPAEGADREGAPARKKRSRRSRGGRRKNGRAAAESAVEEEDEEPSREEPAPPPPPPSIPAPSPAPVPYRAVRPADYVISSGDFESLGREIVISVPERQRSGADERKIAMFCDLENIALGVRDSEISKFDIDLVLERLLEKGKIIVKKAYADWERYSEYKRPFHEAAIELIDIPQKYYSGKNSADIKMVVDAMDLSYSKEHLDTFVLLSGDSDFSPLVSKLKENNKYVIGVGVKNSSSNLLIDNCDEFIYYEDVWRDAQRGPKLDGLNKKNAEAFSLMVDAIQALARENKDVLWGSMIKQTMQRKKPSFNEGYYGYSTFSELLEDAERKNIIKLKKDQRSGTYIVTGFAKK
jgi:uncharacterized protein (TIGR00288 family)